MGGTIYSYVKQVFDKYDFYSQYKNFEISKQEYEDKLDEYKYELLETEIFSPWLHSMIKRLPADDFQLAKDILASLKKYGYIDNDDILKEEFDSYYNDYIKDFEHADNKTYIFPEEERIAYYLMKKLRPKNVFAAGSFYGYWTSFLLPHLTEDSKMILSDIDERVVNLSKKNFNKIPYNGNIVYKNIDSEKLLLNGKDIIDMLVLDPTGDFNDYRMQYRGKAIYTPIIKAAIPRMKKGSIVLAHNIYRYDTNLKPFFEIVDETFSYSFETMSTNGVAIYIL